MKKVWIALLLVILAACSNEDQTTPNEQFQKYIDHWNTQEYDKMYSFFSSDAAELYTEEDSTDRTRALYEDLSVSDLEASFEKMDEESTEKAIEEGTATIPFTVSMNTLAGPVSFEYEANLVLEGEEEEEQDWQIDWDPGFIFPQLKEGGKVSIQTEEPRRGEILDRNQMPLAMNDIIYEYGIVPGELGDNQEQAKKEIAQLLGMSVEAIDNALSAGWVEDNLFVPLKNVLPSEESLIASLSGINGVQRREITGRIYPAGESTGALVGYIRNVNAEDLEELDPEQYGPNDKIGSRGLEYAYEEQLRGKKGTKIVITKEDEEDVVLAETPVEHGENVVITIDINIQEKLYESYGEDSGTSALLDAKSGETLALVSSPSFNPNEILYGTNPNLWADLENDEQNPLLNRFSATFAPGSVMKPITAAIGLANGSIDPEEGIEIEGLTWGNGEGWGDYEVRRVSTSNGPVDLEDALIRSDNIYFAMKAIDMGQEAFEEGLKNFGIGEEFPYEFPLTMSTISASGDLNDEVLMANTSYGQGQIEMSSLHLAAAYSTFLNGGNMIKPTLLTSEETGQYWKENLITADQASVIRDALRKVITEGTGARAKDAEVAISGKTGTAELKLTNDEDGEENSWFVAYPTDDQDIILSMMVESTQDKEGGHAVKKAADFFSEIK